MAWSMHPGHHDDEVQAKWRRPPPIKDGQARVYAPTARSLLVERAADAPSSAR